MAVEADPSAWIDAETKVGDAPHDHRAELRLWLRLLTCTTLIETEVRRRLREEHDFTLPRFDLLAQLDKAEDGLVLGEVSRRLMVSAGNVTALVERLLESGHITRTPSPTDRRVQIIRMTPDGRAAFRRMADDHADWIGSLFDGLGEADMEMLMSLLGRLKTSVRTGMRDPGGTA
jgi:DNA-binding MarR family transcriptional regulator